MARISATATGFCLAVLLFSANAETIRWINPLGGNWSDAANWDLGRLPATGDEARFELVADYAVSVDTTPLYDVLSVTHGHVHFDLTGDVEMMNNPTGKFEYPTFDVRANSTQATSVTVKGEMFAPDIKFPVVAVGASGIGPSTLTVDGSLNPVALATYIIGTSAPGTLVPNGLFGGYFFDSSFGAHGRLVTSGFDCDELACAPGFLVELNGAINSEFGFYSCIFLAEDGSTLRGEAFIDLDISALGAVECYGFGIHASIFRLSNSDTSSLQAGEFAFQDVEFIVKLDSAAPSQLPELVVLTGFDTWIDGCTFRAEHGIHTPSVGTSYPLLIDNSDLGEDPGTASFIDSPALDSVVLRPSWVDGTLYATAIPELWCDADFNFDSLINVFDIFGFVDAYLDRSPRANITDDFTLNFFDLQAYIDHYLAGCP